MSWERIWKTKAKGGMGYRDLECFNMAMLAKQGWRLVQNPDSLVARIFREKYYGGKSFLNSRLGPWPSYARRSIWNAKKCYKKVCFGGWEIENLLTFEGLGGSHLLVLMPSNHQ